MLEQCQPGEGGELLQDYPGKLVRIDCRYCGRTGRYGLALLVRFYGPVAALLEMQAALPAAAGLALHRTLRHGLSRMPQP